MNECVGGSVLHAGDKSVGVLLVGERHCDLHHVSLPVHSADMPIGSTDSSVGPTDKILADVASSYNNSSLLFWSS